MLMCAGPRPWGWLQGGDPLIPLTGMASTAPPHQPPYWFISRSDLQGKLGMESRLLNNKVRGKAITFLLLDPLKRINKGKRTRLG